MANLNLLVTASTAQASRALGGLSGQVKAMGKMFAVVGAADFLFHAVKGAGDLQFQLSRLVNAAGESKDNLKLVHDGILKIMGDTGTSLENATSGLYYIESAGFHGAQGLNVLAAAAKGAKIEGADLAEVANAVSSAMVDYGDKTGKTAVQTTNTLIAAVAHGKTTFQEMASAFVNVGAAGSVAHIPMADLAAAIATMTMHGTDAAKAGTYLRQVIGQLEAPSAKARNVMEGLGLDANKVALTLQGPGGLGNAIQMLDDAISSHLSKSQLILIKQFKDAKNPTEAWQRIVADMPPKFITAFGALAQMTGGVKSLQGFLQLGGHNLKTYRDNVAAVNDAVKKGGQNVEGWASTQETFNVKMAKFKESAHAAMIQVGEHLIPALSSLADWLKNNVAPAIAGVSKFLGDHKRLVGDTAKVVGGLWVAWKGYTIMSSVGTALATFGTKMVGGATGSVGKFGTALSKGLPVAFGLAGVAITGAFTLWAMHKAKTDAAKRSVEELTQAIIEDGNAIGGNSKAVVLNKLSQQGMLAEAKSLGLNLGTLLSSAMGESTDATRAFSQKLNDLSNAGGKTGKTAWDLNQKLAGVFNTTQDALTAAHDYKAAQDAQAKATKDAAKRAAELKKAQEAQNKATKDGKTKTDNLKTSIEKLHGKTVPVNADTKKAASNVVTIQKNVDNLHGKVIPIGVETSNMVGFLNWYNGTFLPSLANAVNVHINPPNMGNYVPVLIPGADSERNSFNYNPGSKDPKYKGPGRAIGGIVPEGWSMLHADERVFKRGSYTRAYSASASKYVGPQGGGNTYVINVNGKTIGRPRDVAMDILGELQNLKRTGVRTNLG